MSYEYAQRVYASSLKGGKLLLMLALAHHADKDGGSRPSTDTLAMEARVTDRQVRRLLNELETDGYIAIEERAIGRGKSPRYQLFPNEKAEEMSAFNDGKADISEQKADIFDGKADIFDGNYSHARLGRLGRSLPNTEKKKKPTYPPTSQTSPPLTGAQQLAFELLVDEEVGIIHTVATDLARKLPPQDIYRAVDKWLPDAHAGKVSAGALKHRLETLKPSNAGSPLGAVSLSAGFRDSELFHRHRLPDELIADGRKRYNVDNNYAATEPRRKYSP